MLNVCGICSEVKLWFCRNVGLSIRSKKGEMGYCCDNGFLAGSHVLVTDLSQRWKCPKLQTLVCMFVCVFFFTFFETVCFFSLVNFVFVLLIFVSLCELERFVCILHDFMYENPR